MKIAVAKCRAAYIPFNGGMTVCFPCCDEWESLGSPKTIAEYHEAVYKRQDNQTALSVKNKNKKAGESAPAEAVN